MLAMILALLPAPQLPAATQGEALAAEAGELFQKAANTADPQEAARLYREALLRFQRLAGEQGIRNGALLYNLANTHFLLGDIGSAILFYRRAELFIPADPNLRHNLRYARSQREDRLPPTGAAAVLRILFFWHTLPSPALKVYLFAILFAAACLATALALLRRSRRTVTVAWLCGALALLALGSVAADEIRLRTLRDGVITATQVVARKGDGTAYQRSFIDPLHDGTEFRLLEERAGWYRIRLADGRTAWIPASAAEMVIPHPGG